MDQVGEKWNFSGFKHHAKIQTLRIGTAILSAGMIRWALRADTHAVEGVGGALPSYWSAQAELGGRPLDTDYGSAARVLDISLLE